MGEANFVCVIPDAPQHAVMLRRSGIHSTVLQMKSNGSRICKAAFDAALRAR